MIYPIVLASGRAGETAAQSQGLPAHFAAGPGIESRFQVLLRTLSGARCAAPLVITGTGCRLAAAAQAAAARRAAGPGLELLLEPGASKPAAAAAVAALHFQDRPEALLLITPACRLFEDARALDRLLLEAIPDAAQGRIVAFGAPPGSAALGFGLLDCRSPRPGRSPQPAVLLPAGCKLTEAGPGALHNTGVYLLRAGTLLAVLKRCAPRILQAAKAALAGARRSCGALQLEAAGWQRARSASFEDAIASRAGSLMALAGAPAPDVLAQWDADRIAPAAVADAGFSGRSCEVVAMPARPSGAAGRAFALASPPAGPSAAARADRDVPQAGGLGSCAGLASAPGGGLAADFRAEDGYAEGAAPGAAPAALAALPLPGLGAEARAVRVERLELVPGERVQVSAGAVPGHLAVLRGCALLGLNGRSRLLWEDQSAVAPAGAGLEISNPGRVPLCAVLIALCPGQVPAGRPAEDSAGSVLAPQASVAPQSAAFRPRPC